MKCLAKEAKLRLCDTLGVSGIVKLRQEDYLSIPVRSRFVHINAIPCDHLAGRQYAIVPIVGWAFNEPVVETRNPVLVYCDETRVLPAIEAIAPNVLPNMIGRPRSLEDLYRIMSMRYGASRGWKFGDIRSKPILMSEFLRG